MSGVVLVSIENIDVDIGLVNRVLVIGEKIWLFWIGFSVLLMLKIF